MAVFATNRARLAGMAALSALCLSGCSVERPLRTAPTASTSEKLPLRSVALLTEPGSPAAERFRSDIAGSLTQAGIAIDLQARLVADVSMSIAPAEVGVVSKPAQSAPAGGTARWLAEPRDKRMLDRCRAQRMKGILSLFDRESGDLVFRSEATALACSFSAEDQRAAADALVADLTASKAI